MEERLVKILSGFRITIPKDLREQLNAKKGGYLLVTFKKAKISAEDEME